MHVRKEHAGAASTGHEWLTDGAVVEVPNHLGGQLLIHDPREFSDVTGQVKAAAEAEAAAAAKKRTPPAKGDGDKKPAE
jgi:hypothetical protein